MLILNIIALLDVNECVVKPSPCLQECTNTNGSFQCYCRPGYTLDKDKVSCTGIYMYIYPFFLLDSLSNKLIYLFIKRYCLTLLHKLFSLQNCVLHQNQRFT